MAPGQAPGIAVHARNCVEGFKTLSNSCQDSTQEPQCQISHSMVCDELGRYKIWAGNLGALQEAYSPTSLDYRLKAQPKIENQIIELLEDLEETLEEACSIASGERPNRISSSFGPDEHGMTPDNLSTYERTPLTDEHRSEAQELFGSIADTITSLFKISMIIRNATPRDRYHKAATSLRKPFNDHYDVDHVGNKFPRLATQETEWLKRRLGQANTQRRHYFRYCREHRDKLSREPKHGPTNHGTADGERQAKLMEVPYAESKPDTKAYTLKSRLSSSVAPTTASTLVAANLEIAEEALDEAHSQTTYATSMGGDDTGNNLRVPSLDKVTKGVSPFECPYCWSVQDIRQERVWRRHVLQDLKPYVCTFEECDLRMFVDRHASFNHELQVHRLQWYCHLCSYAPFKTLEIFEGHMRGRHSGTFPEGQLPALAKVSQELVSRILPSECPFCDDWANKLSESNPSTSQNVDLVVTPAQFRHHVGAHMEQLALFALPRSVGDDGSAKSSGVAANIGSDTSSVKQWETYSVASYENAENPPLHVAAYEGLEAEVAQLLEEGADMNSPGETWGSPLLAAIAGGNEPVVRVLLAAGVDPYIRGRDSRTALEVAAHKGQSSLTRLILATDRTVLKGMSEMKRIVARYVADGEVDMAEKLLVQMIELLGPSHPDKVSSMTNLASMYKDQRRWEEAEELVVQFITTSIKMLGKAHPDTLSSMNNLADVLCNQGRYAVAEQMLQETLKLQEEAVGKKHPDTLKILNNLAIMLKGQGKLVEAEEMFQETLKRQEEVLGKGHPDTLSSRNNLADVFRNQGRYAEAEQMLQGTLKLQEKAVGKKHPETLNFMNNLAIVLDGQGKFVEAEKMSQETLKRREEVLGKKHPDTLSTMFHLARTLLQQGRYIEAKKLNQRVLQMRQEVLGEDHPDTSAAMSLLAMSLGRQGKYDNAEELHRVVLQKSEKVLGPDHFDTLLTVRHLASLFDVQGRYEEAASFYQRAVEGYKKALGAEDPLTLRCSHKYTNMLKRREETLGTTSAKLDELALKEAQDS